MKYAIFIYQASESFQNRDAHSGDERLAAWAAYFKTLDEAGVVAWPGSALQAPATAKSIRGTDAACQVQDGPFADTKEQLGGVFVIDVASMDEAVKWASGCPACAEGGGVEVRPVWEMSVRG